MRNELGQVFEPFREFRLAPRGRVPARAQCLRCGGRSRHGLLCAACIKADEREHWLAVEDYWRRLETGHEPDFAPGLIEMISALEKQIGPAAFWPRGETAVH